MILRYRLIAATLWFSRRSPNIEKCLSSNLFYRLLFKFCSIHGRHENQKETEELVHICFYRCLLLFPKCLLFIQVKTRCCCLLLLFPIGRYSNYVDPIWCYFFSKIRFKYLEVKYWTYWTFSNKYIIPGPYLMDPISFCFFWSTVLND